MTAPQWFHLFALVFTTCGYIYIFFDMRKIGEEPKPKKGKSIQLQIGTGNDVADGALERPGNTGK